MNIVVRTAIIPTGFTASAEIILCTLHRDKRSCLPAQTILLSIQNRIIAIGMGICINLIDQVFLLLRQVGIQILFSEPVGHSIRNWISLYFSRSGTNHFHVLQKFFRAVAVIPAEFLHQSIHIHRVPAFLIGIEQFDPFQAKCISGSRIVRKVEFCQCHLFTKASDFLRFNHIAGWNRQRRITVTVTPIFVQDIIFIQLQSGLDFLGAHPPLQAGVVQIFFICFGRIRQQAHCRCNTHNHCHQYNPKTRFTIVQDILDPSFRVSLAKGKGRRSDFPSSRG